MLPDSLSDLSVVLLKGLSDYPTSRTLRVAAYWDRTLRKMALCLLKAEETGKKKSIPRRRLLNWLGQRLFIKSVGSNSGGVLRPLKSR